MSPVYNWRDGEKKDFNRTEKSFLKRRRGKKRIITREGKPGTMAKTSI